MVESSGGDITPLARWGQPVPDGQGGIDAFRALYADPVTVNGTDTDLGVLVDRARMLQGELPASGAAVAVTGLDILIVDEDADRVTAIWAAADWLGLLVQAGAVSPIG